MFCINIYEQFSARTQMAALTSVLHFLQKLAHHHKTGQSVCCLEIIPAAQPASVTPECVLNLSSIGSAESSSVTPRRLGVQRTGRSDSRAAAAVPVVSLGTLSAQQVRLLQYHLTKLLPAVLQHEAFIAQVSRASTTVVRTFSRCSFPGLFVVIQYSHEVNTGKCVYFCPVSDRG